MCGKKYVWLVLAAVTLAWTGAVSANVIDFSTDPSLAGSWTENTYYDYSTGGTCSASWTSGNTWLDLSASMPANASGGHMDALRPSSAMRANADPVTMTIASFTPTGSSWDALGLTLSTSASPTYAGSTYQFELFVYNGSYSYRVQHGTSGVLSSSSIGTLPSTVTLDIVRDGSYYVFKANGAEIYRDSTYGATNLPYYAMYWGGGDKMSLAGKVDDFGIPTPEPGTLVLVVTGLIGLLAYAWRKRR